MEPLFAPLLLPLLPLCGRRLQRLLRAGLRRPCPCEHRAGGPRALGVCLLLGRAQRVPRCRPRRRVLLRVRHARRGCRSCVLLT